MEFVGRCELCDKPRMVWYVVILIFESGFTNVIDKNQYAVLAVIGK